MSRKPTAINPTFQTRNGSAPSGDILDTKDYINEGIYLSTWTIVLTGEVNDDMYNRLVKGLQLMTISGALEVNILLSSGGGHWDSGIAIFDTIRAYPKPVTIQVLGSAQSMATVILQAADTRLIGRNGFLMIHDGEEGTMGSPGSVRAFAKHSKYVAETMYRIYAEGSKQPASYWRKVCVHDCYLTAAEALDLGLVDGYIN
jgi:ATP-dependent protease ClpP protease subunit